MIRGIVVCTILMTFMVSACDLLPTQVGEITRTATASLSTPGVTLQPSEAPLASETPREIPTWTPIPTFTITPEIDLPTPYIPAPPRIQYTIQPGTPIALTYFPHPELQCNWMGVGGQVFGLDSKPMTGLILELRGELANQAITQLSLSGSAPAWGPSGYEFQLANQPIASDGTLWIQLFDVQGMPLSDKIYFTTYGDCLKNSIMINLQQISANDVTRQYLPLLLANQIPPN